MIRGDVVDENERELPVERSVSSVVVSWNTRDLLASCLASLAAYAPDAGHEIVVVDNGSTDGSAEMVRAEWPGVLLVANDHNLGYQVACNQGITASSGELLLLVNADAWVQDEAIATMAAAMTADETIGIVGPRLVYRDGSWQRWTAGRAPGLSSIAAFYLGLERVSANFAARSLFLAEDTSTAFHPDWVSSACMLVRRGVFDDVGLLDERYLCYMDDVDLCERARTSSWQVFYEPKAEVVHVMGEATRRQTGRTSPAAIMNFNDYVRRLRGRPVAVLARAMELVGFSGRALAYVLRSRLTKSPERRRQASQHARNAVITLRRGYV